MPSVDSQPKTLYDKVFSDHIVNEQPDGTVLLYIGRSFSHSCLPRLEETDELEQQTDISSMK